MKYQVYMGLSLFVCISFAEEQKAHKESMEQQAKSFDFQKQTHKESLEQKDVHRESMDCEQKSFDHQKHVYKEAFAYQQKVFRDSKGHPFVFDDGQMHQELECQKEAAEKKLMDLQQKVIDLQKELFVLKKIQMELERLEQDVRYLSILTNK